MKHVFPIVCFAISLALGWLVTSPTEPEPGVEDNQKVRKVRGGPVSTNQEELSEVRRIDKLDSYDQQVYQVIALASSIPIEDIPEWHREELMNGLEGDLETLFWRITSERWLEAAPKEFLDWAYMMNYRQADLHFSQWLEKSPEDAENYLKKYSKYQRGSKLAQAISRIAKSKPEVALELLARHAGKLGTGGGYYTRRMIDSLVQADLESLLESRASWSEAAKRQLTPQIAYALMLKDFSRGISMIQDENVSWRNLGQQEPQKERRKIADLLLKNRDSLPDGMFGKILESSPNLFCSADSLELFQSTPEELGISDRSYNSLVYAARYIPLTAKNSAQFMELINGERATLSHRKGMLQQKISEWDRKDSEGLRAWLGTLDDPDLHETADLSLTLFDAKADEQFSKPSVSSDIGKIMSGGKFEYDLQRRVARWNSEETQKAIEAFQGLTGEEKGAVFKSATNQHMYEPLNYDFLKVVYAEKAANPSEEGEPSRNIYGNPYTNFTNKYAAEEPAKAAEWASQLAVGKERDSAIKSVAKVWQSYSPREVNAWIDTLPASDQTAAREAITSSR